MLPMENLEKEVCGELRHSLYEWGVNLPSDGDHVRFRQRALRDCVGALSKTLTGPIDYKALKSEKFPKNYSEAYDHVLRNDEVSDQVYSFGDRLGMVGFLQPSFRSRDRRTGKVNGYKVKPEYQRFSSREIDPLNRFQFNPIAEEDLFFDRWFVDDNDASRDGLFFEAMLACHALQFESCYNCKFQKALRWNGGGSSSWQDMICINCGATYEVKTKASMEKIEKALHFNNIPGGSFSSWCQMRNSEQSAQKMYLVILPREHTVNRQMKRVYPVTIAEISKVLPRISEGSFNRNYQSVGFKSVISVKSKSKWFDLPYTGEFVETGKIAISVFKDRFSKETYNRLHGLHFGVKSDEKIDEVKMNETALGGVGGLVDYFKNVKIAPDDWEDLASDEDEDAKAADPANRATNELEKVEIAPNDWEDLASDSD